MCNRVYGIEDFLDIDAGFAWVEVAMVHVYSCYFSPNDPFEVCEIEILLLEESLSKAGGPLKKTVFRCKLSLDVSS